MKNNLNTTWITVYILFTTFHAALGQSVRMLEPMYRGEAPMAGKAVIYGNFVQRLGFNSGGFPQDIRLLNLNTNEIVTFRVKPTFKSAKESPFCYSIDPGEYAIADYYWTQSKWYGGTMNTEPIFKNKDALGTERFTLRLYADTVYYTGTWHFDTEQVFFSDEKRSLDSALTKKYKKLTLEKAITRLPN